MADETTQPPQAAQAPIARPPAPQERAPTHTESREPNTIFVGKKGVMAYVLAVVTQFNNGSPYVKVKARGMAISRAVDVAEIVTHRFMPDAAVKNIEIRTDELISEDGTKSKVSAIDITLSR